MFITFCDGRLFEGEFIAYRKFEVLAWGLFEGAFSNGGQLEELWYVPFLFFPRALLYDFIPFFCFSISYFVDYCLMLFEGSVLVHPYYSSIMSSPWNCFELNYSNDFE